MDESMLEKVSFFKNNNTYTLVFEETLDPDEELDDENNLVKKVEKRILKKCKSHSKVVIANMYLMLLLKQQPHISKILHITE